MSNALQNNTLLIRPLTEEAQIREYFRVRYLVYTHNQFIPENVDALDIDVYDRHCLFVGAYLVEDGREKMIGGARMILGEGERPLGDTVERISQSCFTERLHRLLPRWSTYYAENTFHLVDEKRRCIEAGKKLVEFGRTVCLPEYRGLGAGKALVLGLYAVAYNEGVEAGLAVSPPSLRPLYEAFACRYLTDKGRQRFADLNTELMAMTVDLNEPLPVLQTARDWATEMALRGQVAYTQPVKRKRVLA